MTDLRFDQIVTPAKIHDRFCWNCTKEATTLRCSTCVRSYHSDCVACANERKLLENWSCPVCIKVKTATNIDKHGLEALSSVVDRAIENQKFNVLTDTSPISAPLINPMSLLMLKEKIGTYKSFEQFLSEARWIEHNCLVSYNENHEKAKIASALLKYFDEEIAKVKVCAECYLNAQTNSDWFEMVCSKPHLIIWAKIAQSAIYWPAKVMSIVEDKFVKIHFFGDHAQAKVPAANCLLFSEIYPNQKSVTYAEYTSALKEADMYIANIRNKFGSFYYTKKKVAFNTALLERYISNLIPGVNRIGDSQKIRTDLDASLVQVDSQTSTEGQENGHLKRKPVDDAKKKNGELVTDVGLGEPLNKTARITDVAKEQPVQAEKQPLQVEEQLTHQSNGNHIEPTDPIDSPTIPNKDDASDCDNSLTEQNATAPFELSQKCEQICEALDSSCAAALSMFHDLIESNRSKTIEIFRLKTQIQAMKTEYSQQIAEAKAETEVARAEEEAVKKEHDKEIAEAKNETTKAKDEIEVLKSTFRKMLQQNRERLLKVLAEKQRILDGIEKIEMECVDKMNKNENEVLGTIRDGGPIRTIKIEK